MEPDAGASRRRIAARCGTRDTTRPPRRLRKPSSPPRTSLITATPSRTPLVRAGWLRAGQHVTALGSDSPGKQELDAGCLARADLLVVDRLTQCASFGELRHALDAGLFRPDRVHAELGEIVSALKAGRTSDEQFTIADLTGVGFQDTAIASAAIDLVIWRDFVIW